MGKKDEWDVEEFRTKYESEEHWKLKKEFLLAHKDKIKKKRLICLAQVFVNVQLMRCKYPDPVMRQVAELSKGIGVDYKTKQKERLQRTFVKASDAAAAKVQKLKINYAKKEQEKNSDQAEKEISDYISKIKSNHSLIECDPVSSDAVEEPPKKKKSKKKSGNNLNDVSESENFSEAKMKIDPSHGDCASVSSSTVNEPPIKKKIVKIKWDNDIVEVSDNETLSVSKMKLENSQVECGTAPNNTVEEIPKKKDIITFNKDENPIVNKYTKALKTNSNSKASMVSFVSPKIASISQKSRKEIPVKDIYQTKQSLYEECFDRNDLYKSNIFLVSRIFAQFRDHRGILKGALEFSKLQLITENIPFNKGKIKRLLITRVNGQKLKLGESPPESDMMKAEESAVENAVETLLKKCFTVVIKKRADGDGEISISELKLNEPKNNPNNEIAESKKKISVVAGVEFDVNTYEDNALNSGNNVGAKMLKMMGWSGGGLGKNEDGIKEPISVNKPIGREHLGVKNVDASTPVFRNKLNNILREMRSKHLSSFDSVVKDLVFSPELSNEQRKSIHLTVRKQFKELNSTSYGRGSDRYLVVRPKLSPQRLVYQVLLQGGATDKYDVHKPGTLTVEDFFPKY